MTIVQTRPGSEGILAWPLRSAACAILSLTDLAGALSRGGRERDRVVVTLRDAGRIGVVPWYSGGEGRTVLWLTALVTVVSSGVSDALAYAAGCGMLGLTAFAWRRRMPVSSGFGLFFLVDFGLGLGGLGPQQVSLALAFACYGAIVGRVAWLRGAGRWCTVGRMDARTIAAGAVFAGVSGLVLLLWYTTTQPDLEDLIATFVPNWSPGLLVLGAVVFSIVNAALEESAYRGVVQHSLESVAGPGFTALALQATTFAALHYQTGFPRGLVGVGLAFIYGFVLGAIRRYSGGLMAAVVIHVLTDLAIVSIVLLLVT